MANTSAPFGFSEARGTGSVPTYEQVEGFLNYNGSAPSTTAIFSGDPLFRQSDGSLAVVVASIGTNTIAGVFVGCKYLSVAQKRTVWSNYWPGSDAATSGAASLVSVYYINDPNAQFLAQTGGSTSVGLTTASVGLNLQFAYGTGNTANGISGAYLDMNSTTGTTTATLPFRLVSLVTAPPGAPGTAAGAYNYAIVAFNNVETKNATAV